MRKQSLILMVLCVLIFYCQSSLAESRTFKWVVVNKNTIFSTLTEHFKKSHPYPKKLRGDMEDFQYQKRLATRQVSKLKRNARKKCDAFTQKNTIKEGVTPQAKANVPATTIYAGTETVTLPSRNVNKYRDCMSEIDSDQLIVDLNKKVRKFDRLFKLRRQHDQDIRKKVEKATRKVIATYANKNGYSLVISRNTGILYNKDKAVLDVTDAVLDYVQKTTISAKK